MKKIMLSVLLSLIVLTACDDKVKEPTINPDLMNTPFYSEEYELNDDGIGVVVASKIYDAEKDSESGKIVIYVQKESWHNEVFLSWTENYLTIKNCSDADCLKYLMYEVFQLEEDEFLNETVSLFSDFTENDDEFILKRRELEGYDGFIEINISENKAVQIYSKSSVSLEQGKKDQIIIESHLYEIK